MDLMTPTPFREPDIDICVPNLAKKVQAVQLTVSAAIKGCVACDREIEAFWLMTLEGPRVWSDIDPFWAEYDIALDFFIAQHDSLAAPYASVQKDLLIAYVLMASSSNQPKKCTLQN